MKKVLSIFLVLFTAVCWAGQAETLATVHGGAQAADKEGPESIPGIKIFPTEATQSVIETGISYNGQRIDFFGSMGEIETDAIIVKLTSPAETVKLNVKGRFGPFWMNTRQYQVENVPSIYKIHTTGKLTEIMPAKLSEKLGLGYSTLKSQLNLHILKGDEEPEDPDTVFKGLLQLKQKEELYEIKETGQLEIQEDGLFKYHFNFPPAAKPGTYHVESYLIKDKKLVGYSKDTIKIEKVGLVAFVANSSKEQPVIYGICAVIIALGTGLLVGFIFKGGGHH